MKNTIYRKSHLQPVSKQEITPVNKVRLDLNIIVCSSIISSRNPSKEVEAEKKSFHNVNKYLQSTIWMHDNSRRKPRRKWQDMEIMSQYLIVFLCS